MRTDKIYLVGFMAAGKTSVGRALASRLGWQMIDVDDTIEARERQRVSEIFARHGEAYFRAVERAVLLDLVAERHAVIATGGGTFADPDNRAVIKADGAAIWLDVPLAELVPRIPLDGSRPLAADRTQLALLYDVRRAAYQLSHLRVDASRRPIGELVEHILEWLGA